MQGVHEKLRGKSDTAEDRARYRHIAAMIGCFKLDCHEHLLQKPLGQAWRNHLLAGSQRIADGFDDALSVLLFPVENGACRQAAEIYRNCLTDGRSFDAWTMERLVEIIRKAQPSAWIESFVLRYLSNQSALNGRP